MSNRDESLDMFLQKLDAINSFCESRGDESQHACDGCILNDYCVDIPTRESYKAAVKSTDKCMELIMRVKEENKDGILRDDEPVAMFCNEAMKATLVEYEPTVSDSVVVTDAVDPGEVIVVPVKEFREWLYSREESDE